MNAKKQVSNGRLASAKRRGRERREAEQPYDGSNHGFYGAALNAEGRIGIIWSEIHKKPGEPRRAWWTGETFPATRCGERDVDAILQARNCGRERPVPPDVVTGDATARPPSWDEILRAAGSGEDLDSLLKS